MEPTRQSRLWLPGESYAWQNNIWQAAMERGARVSAVTPNAAGKTSRVIPVLGLSWMAAFPGCQVVSTAGVERQIEEGLWPVLRSALAKYPDWRVREDLTITAPSRRGLPPSTWKAFTTKDPESAEGFHSRWYEDGNGIPTYAPLVIIIDEAKSFQGEKGKALVRALVKRCSPDVVLMISTPGEDDGPFYESQTIDRGKPWKVFGVTWEDCPHLRQGMELQERLETIAKLGRQNSFVKSWIFGEFFRAEAQYIFNNMAAVDRAMSGLVMRLNGERYAALEFSGGGDEQVFGVRQGNSVVHLEAFHEQDTTVLGDIFVRMLKKWNVRPENILADEGGLGKPCNDYIERKLQMGLNRYLFNAVARDKHKFKTRAAEDHFEVRYLFERGALSVVDDAVLKEQIRRRKYIIGTDDGLITLEPKKKIRDRGDPSPDRLDVLIMLFSLDPPEMIVGEEFPRNPIASTGDFRDCIPGRGGVAAGQPEQDEPLMGWSSCFDD
jgi:hypothetical protein